MVPDRMRIGCGSNADSRKKFGQMRTDADQMRTHADQMRTHADRRGQKNPTYLGTLYVLIVRKTYYYSIDCKKIQPRAIPYLRTYASVLLPEGGRGHIAHGVI